MGFFVSFARTGDPNVGHASGVRLWPRVSNRTSLVPTVNESYMAWGDGQEGMGARVGVGLRAVQCQYWATVVFPAA